MIRWITENLGTSAWDQTKQITDVHLVDVRDLVDRAGNVPEAVKTKIDEALAYLKQDQKVIICCDYGMSRSNAIAAGTLAMYEGLSLSEAVRRVLAATGEASIKIEVLTTVRNALGEANPDISRPNTGHRSLLITGGSGFIGLALRSNLSSKNYQVVAPTRQQIDLTEDIVVLDLLVKEEDIDTVVHLANPRIYTTNQVMGVSLTMLKNVLDVCRENRLSLVYLSSWEIYSGYKTKELKASEWLAPCPGGTYGQTKLLSETLIEHYHRYYQLPRLILRSSPVYGPVSRQPRFIWNFLEKALNNEDIVTHKYLNGFPRLDLLYIDDLSIAVVTAIERNIQGIINLGTGIGVSTADVAQHIVDLVGSRSKIRHSEIDRYASNIVMDISHATSTLNWQPTIELSKGLERIVKTQLSQQEAKGE